MPKKERLTREEEERVWAMSLVPYLAVMVGVIIYLISLKAMYGVFTDYDLILYSIGVVFPSCFIMIAGTYEIISSVKVKSPLPLRIKRFLGRTVSVLAFAWSFILIYTGYSFLLSSFLPDKIIIVLALLSTSILIAAVAIHPKTGPLVRRLTGEGTDRE